MLTYRPFNPKLLFLQTYMRDDVKFNIHWSSNVYKNHKDWEKFQRLWDAKIRLL